MERAITLRIKKKYFDLIKAGEKTTEFRSTTDFYKKMLRDNPKKVTLHYQNPQDKITLEIKGISVVEATPEQMALGFFVTPEIYAIHLGARIA